jgi:hypothetical protein
MGEEKSRCLGDKLDGDEEVDREWELENVRDSLWGESDLTRGRARSESRGLGGGWVHRRTGSAVWVG